MNDERRWQIGELEKQTGLTVRALRHYDELGLLTPTERTESGYRLYAEDDVRRLYRIVALRQLGFPLEQIASLLDEGEPDLPETVRRHLQRVERELEQLKRLRGRLAPMVEALSRSQEPSIDEFIEATEETNVNLPEDQWSELFHPDTLYFEERLLTAERSDCEAELLVRLLELGDGMEVLDAPCGTGRHANRLAARGCRVVGLDNDPAMLGHAREEAAAVGAEAEYVEGDLRDLPFEDGRFDALFNWRTSFGFFDERGNRRQLEEFARVLRPGGTLAMDLHSRDDVLRRMPARGALVGLLERDDDLLIERVRFDPLAGRSRTERIVVRDGRVRRFRFSLQTLPASVLCNWLRDAGFSEVEAFACSRRRQRCRRSHARCRARSRRRRDQPRSGALGSRRCGRYGQDMSPTLISNDLISRYAAGPPTGKVDKAKSLREDVEQALGSGYQVFLQGSYRNHTGVADLNDVDIVALSTTVHSTVGRGPPAYPVSWEEIFGRVERALNSHRRFTGRVYRGDKCVKVATDLTLDVVPAIYRHNPATDPIEIYSFRESSRRDNYPRDHWRRGVSKNDGSRTDGAFKPTVRLFKRWARGVLRAPTVAPSFYIECAVHHVPDAKFNTDLPLSFVAVGLYLIREVTRSTVVRSVAGDKDILVSNEWHPDKFERFQHELTPSIIAAGEALSASTASEANRLWRNAFGE